MPRIDYETFEILIMPTGDSHIFSVFATGHRNEKNTDDVKFSTDEVVLDKGKLARTSGTRHVTVGSGSMSKNWPILWTKPATDADAREFGGRLFKAVFKGGVRDCFVECRAKAEGRANLRIKLDLSRTPQLAVWPWEYLHNPDRDQFLAMFRDTPIVRSLQLSHSEGPLEVEPPLRILVMVSMPTDLPKLDAAGELSGINKAVQALSDKNLLAFEVLEEANPLALLWKLEEASTKGTPFHIFHFIGHGVFDTDQRQGKLLFVGPDGKGLAVEGQRIGACLNEFRDLRLVLLNSCEGARLSRLDPYAGVAQKILQVGQIPAALAMQFSITDSAAATFAKHFYQELAQNNPLEESLAKARLKMFSVNNEEWATPVLYMHASDGHVLQVQSPQRAKSSFTSPNADAPLPHLTGHYEKIKEELDTGRLVIFLGLNVNLYGRQLRDDWCPGPLLPSNIELSDYLRRMHQYSLSGVPVATLAQRLVVNRGSGDLYDAFASTFNATVQLPELYPFLGQVVKRTQQRLQSHPDPVRRRPIILTTNYDKSVERGFYEQGINVYHVISYSRKNEQEGEFQHTHVKRVELVDGALKISGNTIIGERKEDVLGDYNPVIIKLPGAVESVPNYVVTEDEFFYLARRDLLKMLPNEIVTALTTSGHLYLGYNVQDWPFRALLFSIWEDRKPKYPAWAVIPNAEDHNKSYWHDCRVEVVEALLEDYVTGLQRYLFGSKGASNEPGH